MNEDIDNNTNNANDHQITNIDNSQELTLNNDDNDEKSTDQCSREPSINEDVNTPTGLQNKRSNCNILDDIITTLKADMIAMKNFMMQSENMSSNAFSTKTQVQSRAATQTSNGSNGMLVQALIKFAKQHNSSNGNTRILTSPNRFGNLRLQDE